MVVITGPAEAPQTRTLLKAALAAPDPAVCVLRATAPDDLPLGHPAYGKVTQGISARQGSDAFVCRAGLCGLPLAGPVPLTATLRPGGATPLDMPVAPVPSLVSIDRA